VGRDETEFREFVAARYGPLVRAAVLMGCSRPDAEDAAQDALARCYAAWGRVRAADDPAAYAYRVLVNGLARRARRRWRGEVPHADPPETVTDPGPDLELRTTLAAALARLRPEHRQVLVLRFVADLSERRTADVLGVRPGTVKSRTARALALLAADGTLAGLLPDPARPTTGGAAS
jgi:RNA polymerase sigma-70 factor (sigma-E family)